MSTMEEYDCIVIGAGVEGSFTAYQLAKNNKKTLLLEQFVLPHSRGSSHGQTRIIRKAYEQDFYVHMMEESYQLWAQLEKEANVKLYRQTGLLVMGPEEGPAYQAVQSTLRRNQIETVVLSREDFSQHVPKVNLAEGDGALVETSAGVLYAERALGAVQGQFKKLGGILKDGQKVTDITPGPVVTVSTSSSVYRAKSLVITAGPWTNTLLSNIGLQLPLKVLKINVCYWKEEEEEEAPGTHTVNGRFPFLHLACEERPYDIYGLPANEHPGLTKVCCHTGKETNLDQAPLQSDRSDIEVLQRYVARCLPGLQPVPAVVDTCFYTVTPDHHFVLDCHPTCSNIIIGAGFSGHGFKFGPIIGKLLGELSQGEVPSHDLSPFRIGRFPGTF